MDNTPVDQEVGIGLPRRRLLQMIGMGGLALSAGPTLLSACGSSDGDDEGAPTVTSPNAPADSASGGTGSITPVAAVDAVLQSSFDPLDPHRSSNAVTINLMWYVYEALYAGGVSDPTEFSPELASGPLEQVDDVTYRARIREGATFHNGSPVTADDVAFSFERVMDPDLGSFLTRYLANIESVTATGDDEVTISLVEPSALVEARLAVVKIVSREVLTGPNATTALEYEPVGSGPYRMLAGSPTASAELERYDDYNGPVTTVAAERINFQIVTDPNARVAAISSGDVDIINNVQYSSLDVVGSNDDLTVGDPAGYAMHALLINAGKAPFDDVRVRQALMYGIDRSSIVDVAYYGRATPAHALVPEISNDFVRPETIYEQDVERARQLLAEAGYPDGVSFELQVGVERDGLVATAELMQQQLAECGMEVEILQGQIQALYARVTDASYQAFYAPTSPGLLGSADAEFIYRWLYYGSFPVEFLHWDTPELDQIEALLDSAVVASSNEDYLAIMGEVQQLCAEQGPMIPIVHLDELTAWNPSAVPAVTPYPVGGLILASDV